MSTLTHYHVHLFALPFILHVYIISIANVVSLNNNNQYRRWNMATIIRKTNKITENIN